MKYILNTRRLRVREFEVHDAGFIVELLNTPGWLEFIGDRNVRTEKQAKYYLENGPIKSYRENGFGLYLVETKESVANVGMCGILKRDSLESPNIGFAFLPEHTGKGYALEVAMATLKYAEGQLKLPKISAITKPDNKRSIRLLEAIGLKLEKHMAWSYDNQEVLLYSIALHP